MAPASLHTPARGLHRPRLYGGFVSPTQPDSARSDAGGAVTFTNINPQLQQSGRSSSEPAGIAPGGTAWFSLEDAFTLNSVPNRWRSRAGSLVLLGTGILTVPVVCGRRSFTSSRQNRTRQGPRPLSRPLSVPLPVRRRSLGAFSNKKSPRGRLKSSPSLSFQVLMGRNALSDNRLTRNLAPGSTRS